MYRLDLAPGEFVLNRDGEFCKVVEHNSDEIVLQEHVLNGFGHTLWTEPSYSVSIMGKYRDDGIPHGGDIARIAWIKSTLFGFKIKTSEIGVIEL